MSLKNAVITLAIVAVMFVISSVVGAALLSRKVKNSTIVYKADVDVKNDNMAEENSNVSENLETSDQVDKLKDIITDDTELESTIDISLLGEIMMGGIVTKNNNYLYTAPFKNVYNITKNADFTYANFSTNITNLEKIENAKSKYLVTKNVIDGLKALGLDCVSIASDHIADYDKDIFNNTVNTLEDNDIFVAGREDMPVYFEKGNKKVAIVSTNNVFIGTKKNYTKLSVSVYSNDNLIKNIKEAKKSADIVIADIHWGREYEYGVTDQMRQISKVAIDAGADLVIGSHAVGVYPLESYNGKPIIFSTGYFISDTSLYVGKEGFIFNVLISSGNKISEIVMTPIYINDKKEVLLYDQYNSQQANEFLEMHNNWEKENGFDSKIEDNKIHVYFPQS